jgi:nucleoside-diphosphate-sugar epimerase
MRQVYVEGLRNVLDRLPPPACFLYVSSTSVYGQTGGEEVDENAATEPLDESGRVVLAAEALLRSRCANAVVLRLAGIYGPGRLLRQQALQAGQPLTTDPDKWLNLIHVEDGATAVAAAEQRGTPGSVYNICDGQPVQRREFYRELARQLRCPVPQFIAPSGDVPVAGRELANRRICNRKMSTELGVILKYPSYREGLASIVSGGELN